MISGNIPLKNVSLQNIIMSTIFNLKINDKLQMVKFILKKEYFVISVNK